jgi:glycosyltransferase involved in cell wall biosynthesis
MYIFQIIDGLSTGGAERLQVVFAKEARRRGFKHAVISLEEDGDSQFLKELRALGVRVYCFPTKRILDFNNLRGIIKLVRAERPDIIHTHLTYSNILGSVAAGLAGIPAVATMHSTVVEERLRAPRTESAEKFALRYLVREIIACGPAVARYFQSKFKDEPVVVIPNAVDDTPQISLLERYALRKQIIGDSDRFIIISVGRFESQKGFKDLLNAFSVLHVSHPTAFLAIVGGGHMKNELEQKIEDLSLSDDVRLLGWRSDVPKLLQASDMFVLASHWEGLPIAVLEAMAAGLPIVATDVGDIAWAVDFAGVIVPPRQPEMLAEAMAVLIGDPGRLVSLGRAARARIEETFSPSEWFDKIISVYQRQLH